jgi:hypothetical protein
VRSPPAVEPHLTQLWHPQYIDGEVVKLWVNKVGPANNPQETYNYYSLPFCKPNPEAKAEHSWGGLGEVLQGNELINSQMAVKFKGGLCVASVQPLGRSFMTVLTCRASVQQHCLQADSRRR